MRMSTDEAFEQVRRENDEIEQRKLRQLYGKRR